MRCTKCQSENSEGARFCGHCGALLESGGREVDFSHSRSRRVIYGLLVLLLASILAIGGWKVF